MLGRGDVKLNERGDLEDRTSIKLLSFLEKRLLHSYNHTITQSDLTQV